LFQYAAAGDGIISITPGSGAPPGIADHEKENSPIYQKKDAIVVRELGDEFRRFFDIPFNTPGKMLPGCSGGTSRYHFSVLIFNAQVLFFPYFFSQTLLEKFQSRSWGVR